jgi:hypothetical protein
MIQTPVICVVKDRLNVKRKNYQRYKPAEYGFGDQEMKHHAIKSRATMFNKL